MPNFFEPTEEKEEKSSDGFKPLLVEGKLNPELAPVEDIPNQSVGSFYKQQFSNITKKKPESIFDDFAYNDGIIQGEEKIIKKPEEVFATQEEAEEWLRNNKTEDISQDTIKPYEETKDDIKITGDRFFDSEGKPTMVKTGEDSAESLISFVPELLNKIKQFDEEEKGIRDKIYNLTLENQRKRRGFDTQVSNESQNQLNNLRSYLSKTQKLKEDYKKFISGTKKGIGTSLYENAFQNLPFISHGQKMLEDTRVKNIYDKEKAGEELNDLEKVILEEKKAEILNEYTLGGQVVAGTLGSINRAIEMYFTMGAVKGAESVKTLASTGFGKVLLSGLISPSTFSKAMSYRSPKPEFSTKDNNISVGLKEGDSISQSLSKGYASEVVEQWTETLGGFFDKMGVKVGAEDIAKTLDHYIFQSFTGKGGTSILKRLLKSANTKMFLSSPISETLEEEVGEPIQAWIDDRDYAMPFFSEEGNKRLLVESISALLTGGILGSSQTGQQTDFTETEIEDAGFDKEINDALLNNPKFEGSINYMNEQFNASPFFGKEAKAIGLKSLQEAEAKQKKEAEDTTYTLKEVREAGIAKAEQEQEKLRMERGAYEKGSKEYNEVTAKIKDQRLKIRYLNEGNNYEAVRNDPELKAIRKDLSEKKETLDSILEELGIETKGKGYDNVLGNEINRQYLENVAGKELMSTIDDLSNEYEALSNEYKRKKQAAVDKLESIEGNIESLRKLGSFKETVIKPEGIKKIKGLQERFDDVYKEKIEGLEEDLELSKKNAESAQSRRKELESQFKKDEKSLVKLRTKLTEKTKEVKEKGTLAKYIAKEATKRVVRIEKLQRKISDQKATQKDLDNLKLELEIYAKEKLPPELRSKIMPLIRNTKLPTSKTKKVKIKKSEIDQGLKNWAKNLGVNLEGDYEVQVPVKQTKENNIALAKEFIDKISEKYEKKTKLNKIRKTLKKVLKKPKKDKASKISKEIRDILEGFGESNGKMTAEKYQQTRLEYIKKEQDRILKSLQDGKITNEEAQIAMSEIGQEIRKNNFKNLDLLTSEQLESVQKDIDNIIKVGKDIVSEEIANRKEEIETTAQELSEVITEGRGIKKEGVQVESTRKKENWLNEARIQALSLDSLLNALDQKSTKDYDGKVFRFFEKELNDSRDKELAGAKKSIEKVMELSEKYDIEEQVTKVETIQGVELTHNEIYEIYLSLESQGKLDSLKEGNNMDEAFIEEAIDKLSEKEKEFLEEIFDFYDKRWEATNEVFKEEFFVDMIRTKRYTPMVKDLSDDIEVIEAENYAKDLLLQGSINRGQTVERTGSKKKLKLDFFSNLINNIQRDEFYKAFRMPMKKMNKVLNKLKPAISQEFSPYYFNALNEHLRSVANQGAYKKQWLDANLLKLRQNIVPSLIANPITALKQVISLPGFLIEINEIQLVKGVNSYLRNKSEWDNFWDQVPQINNRSETLNREIAEISRGKKGIERIFKKRKTIGSKIVGKFFNRDNQWGLSLLRFGDAFAVRTGATATYLANGGKITDIETGTINEEAMRKTLGVVRRTQPTGDVKDLSLIQKSSTVGKFLTMFMNQPRKYTEIQNDTIKGLINKKEGAYKKLGRAIAYSWLIPSVLFTAITSGGGAETEDYLLGAASQPIRNILVIGGIMEAAMSGFGYNASALESAGNEIAKGLQELWKGKTQEGLIRLGELAIETKTGISINPYTRLAKGLSDLKDHKTTQKRRLLWSSYALKEDKPTEEKIILNKRTKGKTKEERTEIVNKALDSAAEEFIETKVQKVADAGDWTEERIEKYKKDNKDDLESSKKKYRSKLKKKVIERRKYGFDDKLYNIFTRNISGDEKFAKITKQIENDLSIKTVDNLKNIIKKYRDIIPPELRENLKTFEIKSRKELKESKKEKKANEIIDTINDTKDISKLDDILQKMKA